jgi:hypothetical protein
VVELAPKSKRVKGAAHSQPVTMEKKKFNKDSKKEKKKESKKKKKGGK